MPPPRPHLLARSRFAQAADRAIGAIWARGLHAKPELTPEALWPLGAEGFSPDDETAGRRAEDVADFRERLAALCRSLRQEARLNALGHTFAYGQLKTAIRVRHQLGRLWREQPGIAQTAIAPPIIVVGQMRSGTTRLHRLLAADPAHAGTPLYRALGPARPSIARTRAVLAVARRINPWMDMLHPFGAARVDEELAWLSHALSPCALEAQFRIPAYVSFSETRDASAVYREFARILRTDAGRAGNAARPRVLKCPQYAEDLAPLLAQFPDARVVLAERPLADVLVSSVSVVASQTAGLSCDADLSIIEAEWRRKLALREERVAEALAAFAGPVVRVPFAALDADWEDEVRRVYAELALPFTAAANTAMRAEMGRTLRSPHRGHASQYRELARA